MEASNFKSRRAFAIKRLIKAISFAHADGWFSVFFFFFNDTATTEIYTLSLHDALPISLLPRVRKGMRPCRRRKPYPIIRSEEHTSELQSRLHLVCRLLLEKKNAIRQPHASCWFIVFDTLPLPDACVAARSENSTALLAS